ncbi:NUDIX hydrolase [Actinomadura macrotermitis]|uniref:NADH pyrophosphatase n=1 Tax=Actinomadura macrotermitis TaxID=2585200 RepID=A0A7K0BY66_9ACTN|nr:NUDIX domain-containing protein [Actinomadura macrotermitis]MQY05574.1 NADH pyrophosphatase [Actinomadura macrotermitis]
MYTFIARLWKTLGGRTQWRLARLQHSTFLVYAAGIVRDDEGRVLLLRHRLWPDHRPWGLPGGYVNAGERLPDGVAREVLEETSLRVRVRDEPVRVRSGYRHRVEAFYEADLVGGELALEEAEILEAGWFSPDALPAALAADLKSLIRTLSAPTR